MRLFVAVVPPPEVRERALKEARSLSWEGHIRWLPPENLHLTLRFLGETPDQELPGLRDALEAACSGQEAFDLTLQDAGAFPSADRARVLWVGVGDGLERLNALAGEVDAALERLEIEREKRPFHPHLTVGRARTGDARLGNPGSGGNVGPIPFEVGVVELVQSRLSREGAVYSIIASFPLDSAGYLSRHH